MSKGHKGHGPAKGHDHEEHEEHVNHEAWVIPYADMLTLLMALFLVLFAIGRVDTEKFKKLAESLHQSIDGAAPSKPGEVVELQPIATTESGVLTSGGIFTQLRQMTEQEAGEKALAEQRAHESEVTAETGELRALEKQLADVAIIDGFNDSLTFRLDARGLVVAISSDKVLFQSGSATLEPAGTVLLDSVADQLKSVKFEIQVEGHTDSRPINTVRYPSNTFLSTARASSVRDYLVFAKGFDGARVHASGYADTRPIDTRNTPEAQARNRRVEIVILSNVTLTNGDPAKGNDTALSTDAATDNNVNGGTDG
jgi:chemotaxis protein MotB